MALGFVPRAGGDRHWHTAALLLCACRYATVRLATLWGGHSVTAASSEFSLVVLGFVTAMLIVMNGSAELLVGFVLVNLCGCVDSFNKYLLNAYHVPGRDHSRDKTKSLLHGITTLFLSNSLLSLDAVFTGKWGSLRRMCLLWYRCLRTTRGDFDLVCFHLLTAVQ